MGDLKKCDRCTRTTVEPERRGWAEVTITVGRGVPRVIELCDACQGVLAETLQRVRRRTAAVTRLRAVE